MKERDIPFPVKGLDVTTEFGLQPDKTTCSGQNVRSDDFFEERGRGGSRPGLVRYVDEPVEGENNRVQHLNVIVTATADAVLGPAINACVRRTYFNGEDSVFIQGRPPFSPPQSLSVYTSPSGPLLQTIIWSGTELPTYTELDNEIGGGWTGSTDGSCS